MPVYLCCPGQDAAEPWRHGIQVFSAPFDLSNDPNANHTSNNSNYAAATATNHTASAEEGQQQPQQLMHRHQQQQQLLLFQQQRLMDHATGIEPTHQTLMMVHAAATTTTSAVTATNHTNAAAAAGQQQVPPGPLPPPPPPPQAQAQEEEEEDDALPGEMMRFQPRAYVPTIGGGGGGGADNRSGTMIVQQQQHPQNHPSRGSGTINNNSNNNSVNNNMPIRRVRHAEIVLVDDVCTAHGRYWLRLRWPGRKGGFAGYIAMGLVNTNNNNNTTASAPLAVGGGVVPTEPMATTDATENPIKNNSDLDGTGGTFRFVPFRQIDSFPINSSRSLFPVAFHSSNYYSSIFRIVRGKARRRSRRRRPGA